jgi:hypothetical protein
MRSDKATMHTDKRKTVFISGSAYEYGRFGEAGKFFIRDLSRAFVKNDFKIVSGYGLGVGAHVVEGALDALYLDKQEKLTDHLQLFPFPSKTYAESTKNAYRDDMISRAGAAVFVFGNKLEDISVKEADGLLKEFEIAKSKKVVLIPVGASGYVSKKLWSMVVEDYEGHFGSPEKKGLVGQLGDPDNDPETLIELILRIAS